MGLTTTTLVVISPFKYLHPIFVSEFTIYDIVFLSRRCSRRFFFSIQDFQRKKGLGDQSLIFETDFQNPCTHVSFRSPLLFQTKLTWLECIATQKYCHSHASNHVSRHKRRKSSSLRLKIVAIWMSLIITRFFLPPIRTQW